MTISKEVLQEIKKKKIEPKSKSVFVIKNYLIWVIGVLFMIVGGLATSAFIHVMRSNGLGINRMPGGDFLNNVSIILSSFWIVLLFIFIVVVYFNLKHTKRGYKYPVSGVIILSISASMLLGIIFYGVGVGKRVEYTFSNNVPVYNRMFCKQTVIWHEPMNGMLVGEVIKVEPGKCYIVDMNNKQWEVEIDNVELPVVHAIKEGKTIRVIGDIINNNIIKARKIGVMPCMCNGDGRRPMDPRSIKREVDKIGF